MSRTDEKAVRAEQARQLLDSPAFQRTVDGLRDELIGEIEGVDPWVDTGADLTEGLRRPHAMLVALKEITRRLEREAAYREEDSPQ